ncbi:MAG TPA: efflux RND transporter periplasmic adaptor subunit [Gemmatimonadaceae bacterium]|nr:efflux RND transporter periplasmic adaptor subunit [Gemmatimonadaceae bacterium]
MTRWLLLLGLAAVSACARGNDASVATDTADTSGIPTTPVQMAQVTRSTLEVIVSGPGHTDVVSQQRLRAPFAATLESLRVAPGDRVQEGEEIGTFISQNSEAALAGARTMMQSARTPDAKRDAQRAVQIASQGLVRMPIRAPRSGVVVSRSASPGDLLSAGDAVLGIAAADSMVFIAEIAQSDIGQVHPGQPVRVELAGRTRPMAGTVYAVLPADTADMTSLRVRVDLARGAAPITLGLFGTAHIVVSRHTDAPTVPEAALLRDDVSGISRVATVTPDHTVHWVTVTPGITEHGRVEIVTPVLQAGENVITMGQVGLPDGAHVTRMGADSTEAPADR